MTDNAPFFFFTLKPEQVFRGSDQGGIDWKVNLGIAILGMVLLVSVAAVFAFLVLPLALSPETRSGSSLRVLYFIAIGLGYIMVEIAFIQRFVLFLGYPTYALTVVVFLMLLSSGAGSLVSRRWFGEPTRVVLALAFIVAALLIYVFVLPRLLESMIGLAFAAKLLVSALLLLPLGFTMGMPFPSGLRALGFRRRSNAPAARRCRVGLGDECRVQRSGFGAGDRHCHPVRIDHDARLRRRSIRARDAAAAHLPQGRNQQPFLTYWKR